MLLSNRLAFFDAKRIKPKPINQKIHKSRKLLQFSANNQVAIDSVRFYDYNDKITYLGR